MTESQAIWICVILLSGFFLGKKLLVLILQKEKLHLLFLSLCLIACYFNCTCLIFWLGYITYLCWPMEPTKIL